MTAGKWRWVHAGLTLTWAVLLVPSVLLWKNSLTWVVLISVYANIAGHFAAWQAARGEDNQT